MESGEIIVKCRYFPESVIPENISLPDFLMREMEKYTDHTAVIDAETGDHRTYGHLLQEVQELTAGLQNEGLKQGEVVALSSTNCAEYFVVALAAQRLGAAVTTANPSYTAEELVKQFSGARAKFVFTQSAQLNLMKEVQLHVPSLEKIFLLGDYKESGHFETYSDLLYRGRTKFIVKLARINPKQDPALILYSSGTTGLPKGVVLTHYNLVANLCQSTTVGQPENARENMLQIFPNDVVFSCFPYFHVGGISFSLFWSLIQGAKVLIAPRFEPENFLKAASKYKATILNLPPPIIIFLSKSPLVKKYDLSSVRTIVCGAASVPQEEARNVMKNLGGNLLVIQAYGMTELSPICHMMLATEESRNRLHSVGTLISSTECKVKLSERSWGSFTNYVIQIGVVNTENGKCCKANERGEIWIRGPQVMKEYLDNPEATKQAKTEDGFLKTGDIGFYDSNGFFYVVDRLKELIKVRGFQVAPAELEGLILTHPSVADAVVIGIPDSYSGELPRAYVIKKQGHSVSEEEIKNYIVGHVARYKELAGGVRFVGELPKTQSGKPLRRILLEKAKSEQVSKL